MAQQNIATTTDNSHKSKQQQQQSDSLLKPMSSETGNKLSAAELYITQKSQMLFNTNNSPVAGSSTSSTTSSSKHAERMHEWHEKQVNQVYKEESHRYKYGTPPCKNNNQTKK